MRPCNTDPSSRMRRQTERGCDRQPLPLVARAGKSSGLRQVLFAAYKSCDELRGTIRNRGQARFPPYEVQENAMANSTRNRTQRRSQSEVDPSPREQPETAKVKTELMGESRSTPETPTLWHGGPRSECWTSASVTESGNWGSPIAAPGRPALRLRRRPRPRTSLHCSRPFHSAATRFFSPRSESLTD